MNQAKQKKEKKKVAIRTHDRCDTEIYRRIKAWIFFRL